MVQVTVGEQDRGRRQPVLREQRVQLVEHTDPGVDDQALLAGRGGHHITVGAEGLRLTAGDEHEPDPLTKTGANRNEPSWAAAHHFLRRYPYTLAGVWRAAPLDMHREGQR
ncbi:hypothetical protein GCM10010168_54320 [Actinoplanes ianthinogenes]|uniref:Uncharacterized protein n=1 Tax=Actinoplanes ianthinogenes TaxID=122358 RepID=A0ABM7LQN9_9ACTN|nr:hypothetical protein Aiant_22260 [Actinoplanes ianthinogenes]GGR29236.1 hypothetical protein GCM10010168_54320 [Actinoplanes ianthinogenes]